MRQTFSKNIGILKIKNLFRNQTLPCLFENPDQN